MKAHRMIALVFTLANAVAAAACGDPSLVEGVARKAISSDPGTKPAEPEAPPITDCKQRQQELADAAARIGAGGDVQKGTPEYEKLEKERAAYAADYAAFEAACVPSKPSCEEREQALVDESLAIAALSENVKKDTPDYTALEKRQAQYAANRAAWAADCEPSGTK